MNYDSERNSVWEQIESVQNFYIFGAQSTAYGVYISIKICLKKTPICFLVSDRDGNFDKLDNIDIKEINDVTIGSSETIIVSTPEIYHMQIMNLLDNIGHINCLYIDSRTEYLIMSRYFRTTGKFPLLEDLLLGSTDAGTSGIDTSGIKMYMAKSHHDMPLETDYQPPHWIIPIQAGAALTDNKIAKTEVPDILVEPASHFR